MEKANVFVETFLSPIGKLSLFASQYGLTALVRTHIDDSVIEIPNKFTTNAKTQLKEYFSGKREKFDINCDLSGFTTFQQEVWRELIGIDFGEVISYKDLAIRCGDKNKVRAVGRANGANPIPIIIPCHRVIGSDGSLVGFSQGLDMKKFLLELEQAPVQLSLF